MDYKIWNKTDKINGVDAEYVINAHNIKENDEIILILDDYGIVNEIQFAEILKSNYKMDISSSAEQVAQEYIRLKSLEEEQTQKDQITLEEQAYKISILTVENEKLLESQKIQDRTIVDNDMRMMDLEWALEDIFASIEDGAKAMSIATFDISRSSTYFNQLSQMIKMKNYDSKEDMKAILDKYLRGKRITQEEYEELIVMLNSDILK